MFYPKNPIIVEKTGCNEVGTCYYSGYFHGIWIKSESGTAEEDIPKHNVVSGNVLRANKGWGINVSGPSGKDPDYNVIVANASACNGLGSVTLVSAPLDNEVGLNSENSTDNCE